MADIFNAYTKRLESPLDSLEVVPNDYTSTGYTFEQVPRALNCTTEGVLNVTMLNGIQADIFVTPGLNPYRVQTIHSGSSAGNIVGMY